MGPVTSTGSVSGSVWKTRTSGRSESRGYGSSDPKNVGDSFWSAGPGVSRSRSRRTGFSRRAHACSIPAPSAGSSPMEQYSPPIVGTGRDGSNMKRHGSAPPAGASVERPPSARR